MDFGTLRGVRGKGCVVHGKVYKGHRSHDVRLLRGRACKEIACRAAVTACRSGALWGCATPMPEGACELAIHEHRSGYKPLCGPSVAEVTTFRLVVQSSSRSPHGCFHMSCAQLTHLGSSAPGSESR